jgi:hypothetical protein
MAKLLGIADLGLLLITSSLSQINRIGVLTLKTLQKKAIEKAKRNGADTVLVQDYFVQSAVTNSSMIYHIDGNGKEITGNSPLTNPDGVDTQFIILFLKYTEQYR